MAIPILWRTKHERYSLQGEVCPACERLVFPPRRLCPYCGREAAGPAADQGRQWHEYVFILPHAAEYAAAGDD
ncbi:MAG TPA: zinc ribbon domain-containing protein [Caldilineaceae bacterium]|nr:zinc ribbon domain-containing protein [Caldilineaceae bacterium]